MGNYNAYWICNIFGIFIGIVNNYYREVIYIAPVLNEYSHGFGSYRFDTKKIKKILRELKKKQEHAMKQQLLREKQLAKILHPRLLKQKNWEKENSRK